MSLQLLGNWPIFVELAHLCRESVWKDEIAMERSRDQRESTWAMECWTVPVLVLQFQSPGHPRVRWPQKCPLVDQANLSCVSVTCSQVWYNIVHLFFLLLILSLKQYVTLKWAVWISVICGIAAKLIDLMATHLFWARMYSGLLRTAVVDAYCPRIIFASAPCSSIRAWYGW